MSAIKTNAQHEARRRLRDVGDRRAALQEMLAQVDQELEREIISAHEVEVPKRAIAVEAGCSRQTVYNVLERRERA